MNENIVVIAGRPNVGKSTLFNYIANSKISIVDDKPGVTRDRIYANCNWLNYQFKLIDTGGLEFDNDNLITLQMNKQIEMAYKIATVIILVVDSKTGLVDLDKDISNYIRKFNKPVVLCVNKVDNYIKQQNDIYEFYELGFENIFPVSSVNRQGLGELLDNVVSYFEKNKNENDSYDDIKISVIGRPNVGKSSIINKLIGEDRVIVSDIAGTTRDAIDTEIIKNNQKYIFIDTAGLRKKSKIIDNIELYSYFRTEIAIDRSDLSIIVLNAEEGITTYDVNIAGLAHNKGNGILLLVNKWDAIDKNDKTIYQWTNEIRNKFSYMPYAEILFVSAKTGLRIDKIYETINIINQNQNMRVSTGVLNEVLINAISINDTPQDKGKKLKIYYCTQSSVKPPTFILFVNDKNLFHFSYLRYIENKFREAFSFLGTPIKFIIKERDEK